MKSLLQAVVVAGALYIGRWVVNEYPFTSKTWYPNGQLMSAYSFSTMQEWHDNGLLAKEVHFKTERGANRLIPQLFVHGPRREWYENGQQKSEAMYQHDKLIGPLRYWAENGALILKEEFVNGQRHGLRQEWFDTGVLQRETMVENGERHGTDRRFWADGSIRSECEYQHGELQGLCLELNENDGNMACTGVSVEGTACGSVGLLGYN
jgi:antitoxin component YwqK of YwqJK toxin-antitoxin module